MIKKTMLLASCLTFLTFLSSTSFTFSQEAIAQDSNEKISISRKSKGGKLSTPASSQEALPPEVNNTLPTSKEPSSSVQQKPGFQNKRFSIEQKALEQKALAIENEAKKNDTANTQLGVPEADKSITPSNVDPSLVKKIPLKKDRSPKKVTIEEDTPKENLIAPSGGALSLSGSSNAVVGEAYEMGSFESWKVYVTPKSDTQVCFMRAMPIEIKTKISQRSQPFFFITYKPSEATKEELSIIMGVSLKENAPAVLSSGRIEFPLLSQGANLWIKNAPEETKVLNFLTKTNIVTVKATSAETDTVLQDIYKISGFSQAFKKLKEVCSQ